MTATSLAAVLVRTERVPAPAVAPLPAYLALARWFGDDQVYLLESMSGPAVDRRHSFVGFGELLSLSVTGHRVLLSGVPALVDAIAVRLSGAAEQDGIDRAAGRWHGRLTGGLLELLRRVHGAFGPVDSGLTFLAFFGYEAAAYLERLPGLLDDDAELPDVMLVLHGGLLRFDHAFGSVELRLHDSPLWTLPAADDVLAALRSAHRVQAGLGPVPAAPPHWIRVDSVTEPAYLDNVRRCLRHIAVGDVYQVQIGHELGIRSALDPVSAYRRLRERNPSPFMYLVPLADHRLVGASPELFAKVSGGTVTMRPIAGTLPAPDQGADRAARPAGATLAADPKEIAEHVMLVDLCRNDIGRICRPDTLAVPEMLTVERFSRVLHLVSTVDGQVAPGVDGFDVVAALFPAGTMTGAPKIRAIEIIHAVEGDRRGAYSGAVGLIGLDGDLNLALCIRTLVHHGDRYVTRACAGVVEASTPQREWTETLAKLSPAHWAVTGEELL